MEQKEQNNNLKENKEKQHEKNCENNKVRYIPKADIDMLVLDKYEKEFDD